MAKYLLEELEQIIETIRELSPRYKFLSNKFIVIPRKLYTTDIFGNAKIEPLNGYVNLHSDRFNWEYIFKANAERYPSMILCYFLDVIKNNSAPELYKFQSNYIDKIHSLTEIFENKISLIVLRSMNVPKLYPIIINETSLDELKNKINTELFLLNNELSLNSYRTGIYRDHFGQTIECNGTNFPLNELDKKHIEKNIIKLQNITELLVSNKLKNKFLIEEQAKHEKFDMYYKSYIKDHQITDYIKFLLEDSLYGFIYSRDVQVEYNDKNKSLIVNYLLPNKTDIPSQNITKSSQWKDISVAKQKKLYDEVIYSIVIRSIAEICHYDSLGLVENIFFNGITRNRSPYTGLTEEKYILSLNANRTQIESLDLSFINPKECFKYLKGVSASKLYDLTAIQPIITPQFSDKRIISQRAIKTSNISNIAEMDWDDFEHFVRQIFEWEFADKGGEVNVTQSSRDGGVDAIVSDPDPIRGGKIIIQAKRYTNTVPVSAVRDLYGTIINEGANKGILITTSDYGPDSYKFAQGKPITLLNGGHLLFLLEKHGKKARIDLQEAKDKMRALKIKPL